MRSRELRRLWAGAAILAAVSAPAARAADKDRFTLFNPTPRESMREMETDRPDVTESPVTVDAGHFQVEMSFFEFTHDRTDGVTTDTLAVLPSNLKVGLLNNVDLQFVVDPYVNVRTAGGGSSARADGFGDTQVRLKVNVLGNDGGAVAMGVMPYVQFPTGAGDLGSDHYEGGLIVLLRFDLPAEFELSPMLDVGYVRELDGGDGYGLAVLHTLSLGRPIVGDLRGYVEYVGVSYAGAGATYTAAISSGVVYKLSPDVNLDGGVIVGLSDSADDYTVFAGMSFRI